MTDNELAKAFETIAEMIRNGGRTKATDPETVYETMRRQKVVEHFTKIIKAKTVSLDTVVALTEKNANYIVSKIPIHNNHRTQTFWAVDVLKFCCDEWGIDYPPEYLTQRAKFKLSA